MYVLFLRRIRSWNCRETAARPRVNIDETKFKPAVTKNVNFQLLKKVIEELSPLITGARVERVFQESRNGLSMILGRNSQKFILLLSPDRALPRLHLVTLKPSAQETTNSFTLYLRSHIIGGRVMSIALLHEDRLAVISFTKQGKEYSLLFELFGAAANLIFLDSSSKILSVFYPVPPAEQVARPLLPGLLYHLPEKKSPVNASSKNTVFQELEPNLSPNNAAERYYERLIEERMEASLRNELQSRLRQAVTKAERLMNALSLDLHSADQSEEYRKLGDLVLGNLDKIRSGMNHVSLTAYDGVTTVVPLDPKRSPARNAELYFKKYKKAKAGWNIIMTRLSQAREELSYMQTMQLRLDHAKDHADLIAIRTALAGRGYVKTDGEKRSAQRKDTSPVYRKIDFLGWEILVGKSAAGNDYITMKIARPDDLWLHAEGLPGSHVVVRNPRRGDIPYEVLLKAASLAAYFSKGRTSGKVSVTYTRAGFVRKPKSAKPGMVLLSDRKSIMVKPQDN
jgi:predicted ribosome quality control (RQC) complex YloA/Tae2 family protein